MDSVDSKSRSQLQQWIWLPLLFLPSCNPPKDDRQPIVRPVRTMVVSEGDDLRIRVFPGKVEASRKVELSFKVSGTLQSLPVKEGQKLKKGDLIAQLRQDEFQARLKTLQGQLDQARAALRALQAGDRPEQRLRLEAAVRAADAKMQNSLAERNRYARLLQSNAVARADFERRERDYRVAQEEHAAAVQALEKGMVARVEDLDAQEAEVRGLEARVVEANLQLQDSTIRALFDGVIAQRFVEQGQAIQAKTPVARYQDVDEIEVAVDVPETVMASDLRTADILSLMAVFSGAPGLEFPIEIREIAQVADPATQTFRVTTTMRAPENIILRPGMTALVTANFRRSRFLGTAIRVPINAVSKTPEGEQVVWVLDAEGVISRRPVKLGDVAGGRVEVIEGLQAGERIAVAGVSFLREGIQVSDLGDQLGGRQ